MTAANRPIFGRATRRKPRFLAFPKTPLFAPLSGACPGPARKLCPYLCPLASGQKYGRSFLRGDTHDTGRQGATRATRGDMGRHEGPGATRGDTRNPGRQGATGEGAARVGPASRARAVQHNVQHYVQRDVRLYADIPLDIVLDVSLDGRGGFPAGSLLGAPGAERNVPGRRTARGATLGVRHRGSRGVRRAAERRRPGEVGACGAAKSLLFSAFSGLVFSPLRKPLRRRSTFKPWRRLRRRET